jgi:hypothetical protein
LQCQKHEHPFKIVGSALSIPEILLQFWLSSADNGTLVAYCNIFTIILAIFSSFSRSPPDYMKVENNLILRNVFFKLATIPIMPG